MVFLMGSLCWKLGAFGLMDVKSRNPKKLLRVLSQSSKLTIAMVIKAADFSLSRDDGLDLWVASNLRVEPGVKIGLSQYGGLLMDSVDSIVSDRLNVEISFSSNLIEDGYFFRNSSFAFENQSGNVDKVFDLCPDLKFEVPKDLQDLVFRVEELFRNSGRTAYSRGVVHSELGFKSASLGLAKIGCWVVGRTKLLVSTLFDQKMGSTLVKLSGGMRCIDKSLMGVNPFSIYVIIEVQHRNVLLPWRGTSLIAAVVKRNLLGCRVVIRLVSLNSFVRDEVAKVSGFAAARPKPCAVVLCEGVASIDGNGRLDDFVSWINVNIAFTSDIYDGTLFCSRCLCDYEGLHYCMIGDLMSYSEFSIPNGISWRIKQVSSSDEGFLCIVNDSKFSAAVTVRGSVRQVILSLKISGWVLFGPSSDCLGINFERNKRDCLVCVAIFGYKNSKFVCLEKVVDRITRGIRGITSFYVGCFGRKLRSGACFRFLSKRVYCNDVFEMKKLIEDLKWGFSDNELENLGPCSREVVGLTFSCWSRFVGVLPLASIAGTKCLEDFAQWAVLCTCFGILNMLIVMLVCLRGWTEHCCVSLFGLEDWQPYVNFVLLTRLGCEPGGHTYLMNLA